MVAIVAGNALGLNTGSGATLGGAGATGSSALGRGNEQVFVNAVTGNLVIQARDEWLVGRGPDALGLRTYNSQGLFSDDNGDNWHPGAARKVYLLTGTVNTAGSTVTRRDEDGSETLFTWNATSALYLSTDGAGAHDSLAYNATTALWTYTEGSTRVVETYGTAGRLVGVADASGNTLSITYNATTGMLSTVTTAGGEVTTYDYNASNQLTQIRTSTKSSATGALDKTLTRVRYGYDASNRLSSVTVDLSPEDNLVADGRVFTTTYTYDGTSRRVAGIAQSDGVTMAFTYEQVGTSAVYRLKTVRDGTAGTTTFTYDATNRVTTVADALGRTSTYRYDTQQRLSQIDAPAVAGVSASTRFTYNASGDVDTLTDAEGRQVTMQYDARGNLTRQTDAAGNAVVRSYTATNQLLTETVAFIGTATGTEAATRYVYDAAGKNLLRFAISAEGRVTEHRYDATGQRTSTLQYAAGQYPVSGLASGTVPAESTMVSWVGTQDRTRAQRQDFEYDWSGQLTRSTSYASVDAAGNGVNDGTQAITQYVYDRRGLLLQSVSARSGTAQYVYDGLGRLISSRDAAGQLTSTSYDDANNRVQVTQSTGLVTTSSYDKAGRLIGVVQSGSAPGPAYQVSGGIVVEGGVVTKTGTDGWNAAVHSRLGIAGGASVSFRPTQTNKAIMVGLNADPATDSSYASIDWGMYAYSDGNLYVYENGVGVSLGSSYAVGDVLSVTYDGSAVKYSRNGVVLRTVAATITQELHVDSAFHTAGGKITDLRFERLMQGPQFVGDAAVSIDGSSAQKGGTVGWNAGLRSKQGYVGGANVSFTPAQTDRAFMVGLNTDPATDSSYASIDWALYCTYDGTLWVYESGVGVSLGTRYAAGDSLSVSYDGSAVRYIRNGVVLRSVAATITQPLYADGSFYSVGAKATNLDFSAGAILSASQSYYDARGQLRMTQDASGARAWALYDEAGRKTGDVNALGQLTEYVYNKNNQLTQSIAFATPVNTNALVDAAGQPVASATVGTLRPAANAGDRKSWSAYDSANRLVKTVSTLGEVTELAYDAAGRVLTKRSYVNTVVTAGLGASPTPAAIAPPASAQDRLERNFYGLDGLLLGTLDGAGGLIEYQYDAAGRQTQKLTRVNAANPSLAATGTLAQVRAADAQGDQRILSFYNARGQLVAQLDGENYLTERSYDLEGNLAGMLRYPARSAPGQSAGSTLASLRSGAGQALQQAAYTYDAINRVLTQRVDPQGLNLSTTYSYDAVNNRLTTTDAKGTPTRTQYDSRGLVSGVTVDPAGLNLASSNTYDAAGRLVSSTDAKGTVTQYSYDALGRKTKATVDPAGLALSTSYSYDAQGNLARSTDAKGQHTRYVYDADGRLRYTLDPENGLKESRYDALGNLVQSIVYAQRQTAMTTTDIGGALISNSLGAVVTSPAGDKTTTYAYDAAGRQIYSVDALGAVTEFSYDAAGQVTSRREYANAIGLPADGSLDGKTVVLSGNGAQATGVNYANIDTTKTYKVRVRVRQLSGQGTAYAGVVTKDANGVVLYNPYSGTYSYAGGAKLITPEMGWVTLEGLITGETAINAAASGSKFFVGSKTATPLLLYNYYDSNATDLGRVVEVDALELVDVATGAVLNTGAEMQAGAASVTVGYGQVTAAYSGISTALDLGQIKDRLRPDAVRDKVARYAYDAAGRQIYSVDALGAVTEFSYDAAGQVTSRREYANAIGLPADGSLDGKTVVLSGNGAQATGVNYANIDTTKTYKVRVRVRQLSGQGTAYAGVVTKDANGVVLYNPYSGTYSYAGGAKLITPEMGWVTLEGLITGETAINAAASGSKFFVGSKTATPLLLYNYYDSNATDLGRVVEVDALELVDVATGAVLNTGAEMQAGAASVTVGYGQVTAAYSGISTALDLGQIKDRLRPDAVRDKVARYAYDAAGRQIYSVDALGAVTEFSYDAAGQVTSRREYANAIGLPADGSLDGKTVVLSGNGAQATGVNYANIDTTKTYKVRVRVRQLSGQGTAYAGVVTKDANGVVLYNPYSGTYSYAGGAKLITPEMGWVTLEGLITGETAINAAASGSKFFVGSKTATPLLLYNYYDSNATDLGRVVEVDALELVDVATGAVLNTGAEMQAGAASVTVGYGQVTAAYSGISTALDLGQIKDRLRPDAVRDKVARYAYDAAGRQIYSVDALGAVTEFSYDAAGQVTSRREYANAIGLPADGSLDGKTVVLSGNGAQATGVNYANIDTTKTYKVRVRVRQLSGQGTAYAGVVTKDANGVVLYNPYSGTYSYAGGAKLITPEMGWVTLEGLITGETAINAAASGSKFFVGSKTATPLLLYNYYDSNATDLGRVVEVDALELVDVATGAVLNTGAEMQAGAASVTVGYGQVTAAYSGISTALDLGQIKDRLRPDAVRDKVARYAYDAAGRQIYSVDALGAVTEFSYDAAGQVTSRREYANAIGLPADGSLDGKTVVLSGNGAQATGVNYANIDTTKTYKVRVRVRQLSGQGTAYAGVVTKDANGVVLYNPYSGTYSYAGGAKLITPEMGWVTLEGLITGETAINAAASGSKFFVGSKTATPLLLYNYYDSNATDLGRVVEVDALELVDVATGAVLNTGAEMQAGAASVTVGYGQVTAAYSGISTALDLGQIKDRLRPDAVRDKVARYAYDAAGRQIYSVDALGAVTEFSYDAAGQVTSRREYANAIGLPADGSLDGKTVVLSGNGAQATGVNYANIDTTKTYKVRVRVRQLSGQGTAYAGVVTKDANGVVLYNPYSGTYSYAGGAKLITPEMGWVTLEGLITGETAINAAASGSKFFVGSKTATPLLLYNYYDSNATDLGRVVEVDALELVDVATGAVLNTGAEMQAGAASVTVGYGQVTAAYSGISTALDLGQIKDRLRPDAVRDKVARYAYDAAGHQVQTTDSLGFTERYTFDALGNKLSFTNKKGSVWTYAYDSLGRMIRETSPQVALTAVVAGWAGTLLEGQTTQASVVTRLAYDTFGNLVSRTEAEGLAEQRQTRYEYDALGRQVKVTYPPVGVYSESLAALAANGQTAAALRTETTRPLSTRTLYDVFGNAVANVDVAGNASYKTYDQKGRVVHEVDAMGYVTGYVRDAFGNALRITRHGWQTTLADTVPASASQAPDAAKVQAALLAAANTFGESGEAIGLQDRVLINRYDQLGRIVEVVEPSVYTFDSDTNTYEDVGRTTRRLYNAFGDLVQTRVLKSALTDTWIDSYQYFDTLGRQTASIDALGYLSERRYDALGNLASSTEYATAAAAGSWNRAGYAAPGTSTDDRTIAYGYDRGNRKTSETRVNVEFSSASDGSSQRGNLVTRYGYDAVGNLTRTTDATGASTYSYYDAMGRVTAVIAPARNGATLGSSLIPMSVFRRDAYGNVVVKIDLASGASAATEFTGVVDTPAQPTPIGFGESGEALYGPAAMSDRRTVSRYDLLGHATQVTDAAGFNHFSSYNERGQLAKTWQMVTDIDTLASTLFQAYQYDKAGRLTHTFDPAPLTVARTGATVVATTSAIKLKPVADDPVGMVKGTNSVQLAWANLIDPNGGTVQVQVQYVERFGGRPGIRATNLAASAATTGATVTWNDPGFDSFGGLGQVTYARISQLNGSVWTTRWEGLVEATPLLGISATTQAAAGVTDTALSYNAFGELTGKSVNGFPQEYFEYDNAGQLWRANSGNGVAKVTLHDRLGRATAEIQSSGSGRDDVSLTSLAIDQVASRSGARRTDTRYDALGRVVMQTQPERSDVQAGVTVRRTTLTAAIAAAPSWFAPGTVTLSWTTLAGMGSGDVKVELLVGGTTYTKILTAEQGAVGSGGFSVWGITAATPKQAKVWKKDAVGAWQLLMNTSTFPAYGNTVEVAAAADPGTQTWLMMRPVGSTGSWTGYGLVNFGGAHYLDATNMPAGNYEYQVRTVVSGRPERVTASGTLLLPVAGGAAVQTAVANGSTAWLRPVVNKKLDRWGNVVEVTDPRNAAWTTTYRWNFNNQMVREAKPDGAVSSVYFDALGRQVAVRDANGNVNGQAFDSGGNLVREAHADGGVVTHRYNAFGERVATTDALGNAPGASDVTRGQHTTNFAYDGMGRLLSTTRGAMNIYAMQASMALSAATWARVTERYTYDAAGRKLTQTDGDGRVTKYRYDLAGHVVQTLQPMDTTTTSVRVVYDAFGHKTAEFDQNGKVATWVVDSSGRTLSHTDLGGARIDYSYDAAGQLRFQTSTRGQNLRYDYDAAGQMVGITDTALSQVTSYAYDLAGRRVAERTVQGGVVVQDNHLAYDNVGRLRDVADGRVHISIQYDKNGNRTFIGTHVNVLSATNASTDTSRDDNRYFLYDEMNRQRVVDGIDTAGNIGQRGHAITYDLNGNRKTDTFLGNRVATNAGYTVITGYDESGTAIYEQVPVTYTATQAQVTETYAYSNLDRLESVVRDGVQVDHRFYDAAGHVLQAGPNGNLPVGYAAALNQGVAQGNSIGLETRRSLFDNNGRLLRQLMLKSDNSLKTDITYTRYDAAGNVLNYTLTEFGSYVNYYAYTLSRFEGYQAATISATSSVFQPGSTTHGYDVNGRLVSVTDSTKAANNRSFINDASGRVLMVTQSGSVERQLVVNGEVLGRFGVGVDEVKPRTDAGDPNLQPVVDFSFGFQPINGSYPSTSPGSYTVQVGDTLQSIAYGAYGDSQLWYAIADANGLASDRDLRVGQTLTVPNRVGTARNDASTFKPYDPSKIVGDTSPNMPSPAPQDDGDDCGGLGQILMIVVAIAVTVLSYGALAEAGYGLIAAGAMSGAAGALASQVVGNAVGVMDGFDWKGIALGALGGAVSGGLAGWNPLGSTASSVANTVVRAAIGNALTQGIAVATGLQKEFNWRGVAAAAVGAGVGEALGDTASRDPVTGELKPSVNGQQPRDANTGVFSKLANEGAFGKFAATALTGLATGAASAIARGGRISLAQLATDAFGNALGDSIVASMQPDPKYSLAGSGAKLGNGGSSVRLGTGDDGASLAGGNDVYLSRDLEERAQRGPIMTDAGPVNFYGGGSGATANAAGNALGIYPSDERGFFPDSGSKPVDEGSRITPAMKEANARNKQALYEKFQRDVQLGEALKAQDAADQAARELRTGWGGVGRGLREGVVDVALSPYHLYTSVRDNGLGGTAGLVLEGLVNMPSTLYGAYSSGDMQTLTAAGVGAAFGLKVPGGRFAGVAERSAVRLGEDVGTFYKVESGGVRGELPLSTSQRARVESYLSKFDLSDVQVRWVDDTNLSTGYMHGSFVRALNIGSDVVPGNVGLGTLTANSRISLNGTLAHELVGHREAALAGRTQDVLSLEEAQASIRAARFGPDLTSTERYTLMRDAVTRLHNDGLRVRDVRNLLYIEHR